MGKDAFPGNYAAFGRPRSLHAFGGRDQEDSRVNPSSLDSFAGAAWPATLEVHRPKPKGKAGKGASVLRSDLNGLQDWSTLLSGSSELRNVRRLDAPTALIWAPRPMPRYPPQPCIGPVRRALCGQERPWHRENQQWRSTGGAGRCKLCERTRATATPGYTKHQRSSRLRSQG